MKLSNRLTRAAASFMVCGMVTACVPNAGIISAGACDNGGGSDFGTAAGVAVGVGAILIIAADKKKKNTPDPQTTENGVPAADNSWNSLRNFEGAGKSIN